MRGWCRICCVWHYGAWMPAWRGVDPLRPPELWRRRRRLEVAATRSCPRLAHTRRVVRELNLITDFGGPCIDRRPRVCPDTGRPLLGSAGRTERGRLRHRDVTSNRDPRQCRVRLRLLHPCELGGMARMSARIKTYEPDRDAAKARGTPRSDDRSVAITRAFPWRATAWMPRTTGYPRLDLLAGMSGAESNERAVHHPSVGRRIPETSLIASAGRRQATCGDVSDIVQTGSQGPVQRGSTDFARSELALVGIGCSSHRRCVVPGHRPGDTIG